MLGRRARRFRKGGCVQRRPEASVGKIRGRDKRLDEEQRQGVVGDVRHLRGGGPGVRPSCICDARFQRGAQLSGGGGLRVPQGDEVWLSGRVFAGFGSEEETLHEEERKEREEERY
ncbi:hypothetical protein RHGRI_027290 [Rhododendron griersonianum]|nr:hypothetical protein RHGRI_027290 [Rhododendron griersonianum]